MATAGPGPKGRLRRRTVFAIVAGSAAVVVAILVILLVVVIPGESEAVRVNVDAVNLDFSPSPDPCFGTEYTNQSPTSLAAGGTETLFVNLSDQDDSAARSCTVQTVSLTSPGFVISSANVPLRVNNTGTATLVIAVRVPGEAFTGDLNLSASVTYVAPNVTVNAVNVTWNSATASGECGLDTPLASPASFSAFPLANVNASAAFASIGGIEYSCTLTSVSVTTPGFSLVSSSAPVTIEFDTFSGVSFELLLPPTAFNGTLDVTLNVSA